MPKTKGNDIILHVESSVQNDPKTPPNPYITVNI